jgi:cytochrome c oxidase assembly protein subunit 15
MVALVGILLTLATWLASRKVTELSRLGKAGALGAFLVAVAQIPMGGITIALELHPLAVMTHFLLGLACLGLAVVAALEAWILVGGRAGRVGPYWLRQVVTWLGLPACAALVVTGAVATASGPHPGASDDVERLGVAITETVYVHVRVAAAFGIGVLVLGWFLWRLRDSYPGVFRLWVLLVSVLTLQAILGEVQYRNALPWGLVLVHVFLAATIWACALALTHVLWRPPAALAQSTSVQTSPYSAP